MGAWERVSKVHAAIKVLDGVQMWVLKASLALDRGSWPVDKVNVTKQRRFLDAEYSTLLEQASR